MNNSASSQRPEIVHRLFLWMISFAFVLALQVLFSAAVFAADQQRGGVDTQPTHPITGKIVDSNGEPIIGANIVIQHVRQLYVRQQHGMDLPHIPVLSSGKVPAALHFRQGKDRSAYVYGRDRGEYR